MSDETIDALAASAYAGGADVLDWAVKRVVVVIELAEEIAAERARNPQTFATWGPLSTKATAGRVVLALMDSGWKPPTADEVAARVAAYRAGVLDAVAELEDGRVPPQLARDVMRRALDEPA